MSKKSVLGLDENIAGLLCYVAGTIFILAYNGGFKGLLGCLIGSVATGVVMLVMERSNRFVRFHALQSILWFVLMTAAYFLASMIGFLPFMGLLKWLVGVLHFAVSIYLMYMAYKGNMFKLPMIGDVVAEQINK